MWYTGVAFNDDHFFILRNPTVKGGAYDLICYEKGQGRNPRHIPLEFHLDGQARSALTLKPLYAPASWDFNQIEHPDTTVYPDANVQFFAAKQGLCIQPANVGFWFLPYSDIDGYLKAHPMEQPVAVPSARPPANPSQTGMPAADHDVLDPGDISSFE